MSMRTVILAVVSLGLGFTACSSYGTSTISADKKPVASVSVSLPAPTMIAGQTERGVAVARDASGAPLTDRDVTWQSSNPLYASVSDSGMISAVAPGSATITASSEGVSGQGVLTVVAPAPPPPTPPAAVATVSVSPASPSVNVGATLPLAAVTRDASGNTLTGRVVTWSSANTGIATVSGTGVVTGVAAGSVAITASSEGRSGSASLTVNAPAPVPVASVTVSPASRSLLIGATVQLSAVTRDASGNVLTGRAVSWSSAATSRASVSGSGLVTAVAVGTTVITATSGTASGTASIAATAPPPPPQGGAAPEPGAGDVVLWQDNFDKATLNDLLNPYATRGDMQLVAGHSGSAVRFVYTGSSYDNLIEKVFTPTTDVYFRYWYRLSPGADPTCGDRGGSGMKWFMAWRQDPAPRYTMGVGTLDGGPVTAQPNAGNEFTTHDNSSSQMPAPFLSNINKSLRFSTTNDGQWHEYTLHIVTGNGGYEQIWIDGTLVLDNSAYHYDHSAIGIAMVNFPGTLVQWFSGCDFTIDVDDFAIWHK